MLMLRASISLRPALWSRAGTRAFSTAFEPSEEVKAPKKREVVKNVYEETEATAKRSDAEIKQFYDENKILVKGEVPKPILSFEEAKLPSKLKELFQSNGITKPTPIQSMCWPLAMSGQDMIGVAQTGSGKTLGFLVPTAVHILRQAPVERYVGPRALVLAPTRELCQQIGNVSHEWLRPSLQMRQVSLFGGARKDMQIDALRRNPHICVATPGRLNDLLRSDYLSMRDVTMLVLDEADRMLDMGFEPQIRECVNRIGKDRQTLMFSATWPEEVRQLARDFMSKEAVRVNIGSSELCANKNITQKFSFAEHEREKYKVLLAEIKAVGGKVLVFSATKLGCRRLANDLRRDDIWCVEAHGDLSQAQRDYSLRSFKTSTDVMIATDVAARGLDLDNIKAVVNYDFPNTVEDYVHRIGRTGRGSKTGSSLTFLTDQEQRFAPELVKLLTQAEQQIPDTLNQWAIRNAQIKYEKFRPKAFQQRQNFNRGSRHSNWRRSTW